MRHHGRPLRRSLFVVVVLGALTVHAAAIDAQAASSSRGASARTEILWDTWGVPHIFARAEADLFRGFGYAQMTSHAELLLTLYARARGRAAEYWGASYLESDRYVRTMGIPERAAQWYAAQSPAFKRNLDAFAEGLNLYASRNAGSIADSLEVALPITAVDVLAHAQHVVHFSFIYGGERTQPAAFRAALEATRGSNAWAIAPSRSASGRALLLANPHLLWGDIHLFYEAHWVGAGVNVYGATLVGFPILAIAFNDSLGWSHTVNTYDGSDTYRLTMAPGGYRFDGGLRPFETGVQPFRVKQADGSLRADSVTVRRSVHGPVIADSGGTALAVRVAGIEQPGMLEQWWQMMRARNLSEFEDALRRLQIPMFNVIYADAAGHILYVFNGRVPQRPRGDVAFWSGAVAGDSSTTLWHETLPYDRLPRLLDPPSGWLQNSNDPPWTATVPVMLRPDSFPAYLAPRFMNLRAQRGARMLAQDGSIGFDELLAYKHDTRVELADRVLDDLLAAARSGGSARARRAADVLAAWDRRANADSRGAILFTIWATSWLRRANALNAQMDSAFTTPWRLGAPITTPRGIRNPQLAVEVLDAVAAQVETRFGALDVPLGEAVRLRYGGKDLPANGAPGDPIGVFRVASPAQGPDGKLVVVAGDTYYAAVEFARPVRARVLLSYGNATRPGSRHRGDQLELFAKQQMREAWLTREQIQAHLGRRDAF
jgi:acyl-homoserine-lactone acylase